MFQSWARSLGAIWKGLGKKTLPSTRKSNANIRLTQANPRPPRTQLLTTGIQLGNQERMSRDRDQRVATIHLDHTLEVADLPASRLIHAQEDSHGQDHLLERTEESYGYTGQS